MKRRTKWILGTLAIPAAALLVATMIGMALPETHSAAVSQWVAAPIDSVWAAMTEVSAFPEWRAGLERVERLPDRDSLPVWRETGTYGTMTLEVTEWDPPRRLVTRIADEGQPFGGTWTYVLEPDGEGTRVTLTEDGEIYNPFFRFMARFVFGHDGTMRAYFGGLTARFAPSG